jgi:hypothetical protein
MLGDRADHFMEVYGVTERGNFEVRMQSTMTQCPLGPGQWLSALSYALSQPEVMILFCVGLGRHSLPLARHQNQKRQEKHACENGG